MPYPRLYEINARCWLRDLSDRAGRPLTLADVPEAEFRFWQTSGFTHIWLMGVWTGGPLAREQALGHPGLMKAYAEALPDWRPEDVAPSPYAISAYRVSPALGGEPALKEFRQQLHQHGLKLILDFVPNHVGLDHPWAREQPELLVQAPGPGPDALAQNTSSGTRYLAFGKDPNCAAWTDTLQLDYRKAETRAAMKTVLGEIAGLCDGVRCDMAMLVLKDVFAATWRRCPTKASAPDSEFWAEAIASTRWLFPAFLFLAEVYWGLEARLQELGFDYTYDKTLYDVLVSDQAGAAQRHLLSMSPAGVAACAHFLENHDEKRIASALPFASHRAAALIILGLPGMRFLHEGQLGGWTRRLPVQLARRASEASDPEIEGMYQHLLAALPRSAIGRGEGRLLTPSAAWAGNPTAQHFILVQWSGPNPSFDLVVVNLATHQSQCYAPVRLAPGAPSSWSVVDLLGSERFVRPSEDLTRRGLYLDLPPKGAQILHFEPL